MGSFFSERFEGLLALPGAVAEAPLLFAVIFLIFAPLIWWKWRVTGKATQKAFLDQTHGLRTSADRKQVAHDTGIGTKEVLVMRPNGVGGMIWFGLLFFGGGAVFYFLVVLPSEPTSQNWLTFAGLSLFAIGSMALIEANQTRIIVDEVGLERRKILTARLRMAFSEIETVDPAGKTYGRGVRLTAKDGRSLTVRANMSGYQELIERLSSGRPQLSLLVKMMKTRRSHA